jgi:hypothetical protein
VLGKKHHSGVPEPVRRIGCHPVVIHVAGFVRQVGRTSNVNPLGFLLNSVDALVSDVVTVSRANVGASLQVLLVTDHSLFVRGGIGPIPALADFNVQQEWASHGACPVMIRHSTRGGECAAGRIRVVGAASGVSVGSTLVTLRRDCQVTRVVRIIAGPSDTACL